MRTFPCLVAAAAVAMSSLPVTADVTVDVGLPPSGITVTVAGPATLRAVLIEICRVSEATCDVPLDVESARVAPSTRRGSWAEVVGGLLSDTGLAYALTPPTAQRRPQLIIVADAARRAAAPDPGISISAHSTISTARIDDAQPSSPPATAPDDVEETADAPAPATEAATAMVTDALPSSPAATTAMTPFGDSAGRPLVVTAPATAEGPAPRTTPFSDAEGQPLVASTGTPEVPGMTPFSDSSGAPVVAPVQDRRPIPGMTPFSDSTGQPLVVPVAR